MAKYIDASRLAPLFDAAFHQHQEKDEGLVVGPDRLIERLDSAVRAWLKYHEEEYRAAGSFDEALAIRDLRLNLIDGKERPLMKLTDSNLERLEKLGVGVGVTIEERRALIAEVRKSRQALREIVALTTDREELTYTRLYTIEEVAQAALNGQTSDRDREILEACRRAQGLIQSCVPNMTPGYSDAMHRLRCVIGRLEEWA